MTEPGDMELTAAGRRKFGEIKRLEDPNIPDNIEQDDSTGEAASENWHRRAIIIGKNALTAAREALRETL